MGVFEFLKTKRDLDKNFCGRIIDTFALITGDCVLGIFVEKGMANIGDIVTYYDKSHREICKVTLSGAEQGDTKVKELSDIGTKRYGALYGVLIRGFSKEDFEVGGTLESSCYKKERDE
ncbi:MAG TPA: hypothetical protein VK071_11475 [Tissierellales bacterium]|nr:hypothetical protein [Tissierellales bacterium]